MRHQTQVPKFSRKNKKTNRQLKNLNSDYYIKVLNPNKKTASGSGKCTDTLKQSASNKKLLSYSQNSEDYIIYSKCGKKTHRQSGKYGSGVERTRSSTMTKHQHTTLSVAEQEKTQALAQIQQRISRVLEAYQVKMKILIQHNKLLYRENKKLRVASCSSRFGGY